jgi:hypothetical protein
MQFRMMLGLDLWSRAGVWKNSGAATHAVRIQYNLLRSFISLEKREDCVTGFRKSSFLGSSDTSYLLIAKLCFPIVERCLHQLQRWQQFCGLPSPLCTEQLHV